MTTDRERALRELGVFRSMCATAAYFHERNGEPNAQQDFIRMGRLLAVVASIIESAPKELDGTPYDCHYRIALNLSAAILGEEKK